MFSSLTCEAMISIATLPPPLPVTVPKASSQDPTEICCSVFDASAVWPGTVTAVPAPSVMLAASLTYYVTPTLVIKVAVGTVRLVSVRAETIPAIRS